jgi:benzoate-CoA ligase family protein
VNAGSALVDARVVAGDGARAALMTPSSELTYAGLLHGMDRAASGLRRLGVGRGDRVALLLLDGVPWVVTFLASLRLGAIAVPMNTRLAPAQWHAMLIDCAPRALVHDPAVLGPAEARALAPAVTSAIVTSDLDPVGLDGVGAAQGTPEPPVPVDAADPAFWLYTSGTTGTPKAAVHTHGDLLAGHYYGVGVLGATRDDRIFATSKLFFAYALGTALAIPLCVGARAFLHPAWPDVRVVLDVLRDFQPTLFFSVPTFYARLLRAELPRDAFASVRHAVSAGERLPAEVYSEFAERFGVAILDGLGATETIYMVLSNRPGACRAGSAGVPVPGTEVRLLDDASRPVPDGEPGVLHVRTPSASREYWNRAEASARAFANGWFKTSDVCRRDADGFYFHVGRADDLFKVAGMWVAPADVEGVLLAHPDVADAGVVGIEERGGLVKPFAFVVPRTPGRDGALVSQLTALAVAKLPAHQRPREIFVVAALPRTATGKLQRFALRTRVPGR